MIKTTSILLEELKSYKNPRVKIANMVKRKELIPIIRGLYETDSKIPGHYLASLIYGPSYLSFEFALSNYGLIPEAVYQFTSATYNKRRRKSYKNAYGLFTYRDIPSNVFKLETRLKIENGYSYIIASPEKALCDMLYTFEPCSNQKELNFLLFNFLRIDRIVFKSLDYKLMIELSEYYKTRNHSLLIHILKKELKINGINS